MRNTKSSIIRMAQMGMLAAVAIVLVAFIHIPIIPSAPFLTYDMADVPILIGTLLFGTIPGLIILMIVSFIQAFLFGGNGWVGLVMHFLASGALIILIGQFYKWHHKFKEAIVGMAFGTIAMTAIMIPMNLILTVYFLNVPMKAVIDMIVPAIIPFNLIKASANCILTGLLFQALTPFINKNKEIIRPI